ncbi:hypothetical protein [Actomonas aquatica]|uniref:Soluble ligand binding domain-containing protein n=1 Tax=Actomonas aquatica TaxID=2866162 RepID=A0ABZ1CBH0_9BACT|nr:hypothetical protein [Opitutus sp. WL0086]WRQ88730.1 hypothetical protein K1X11_004890 [Opitutus sp. WL0086]
MKPLRCFAGILIATTPLLSGCTILALAKAATSPVGVAAEAVKQTSKVAAKSVATSGKVAGSAVSGAGRVAVSGVRSSSRVSAASVEGSGRVSAASVNAGTRVAAASVEAAGTLSAASIRSLSKLSAAGMVTFVDISTGTVVRVPWRTGLNVYGSSAMAKVGVAQRALAVIRGGRLVYQTAKALAAARALPVQPGDVIRLADYLG